MPRFLRNAALFLAACLALAFLTTCGKDNPTQPKPPEPPQPPPSAPVATRITITPSPLAFNALATTQKLTAVVYDQNGGIMSGAPVNWTSSDASVATVSGLGVVNAIDNGTARITARSGSASASVEVRVAQVAASIRLSPERLTLGVLGRTAIFQATVLDAGRQAMPDAPVTWASSDESVVTVSAEGVVTAVGNGTATITATSGGVTATGDVMVAQDASLIEVMPASARFEAIGQTLQLEAVVYDPDGSAIQEAEINWTSGDPLVVSVDDEGLLAAVGQGMTEVTAELGEASTSIPVAVMQEVTDLEVAPPTTALVVGDTLQITVRATDALGVEVAGAVIDWSSSDEGVAIVDISGVVIAVGAGAATITAASGDVTAESHLEIDPRIPSMIEVMPESVNLSAIGAMALLSAVVYDQRDRLMADFPLSWASGDPAVAEVDEKGRVISVGEGATEITVQADDASVTVPVVVKQVVSALTISRISAEMVLGDTLRFRAQARDALNVPVASATIYWTSSDMSVAVVDTEGLVRAVGEGTADITASAGGVSIAARITVMHPDRPLLAMLYNALDGPNWKTRTNWLSTEPLGEWQGVTVGNDNRVSSLNLSNNNLSGFLPPVLGQLSSLQGLALNGNRLKGPLPPELGLVSSLTHLYLYENQLSGDIPPELGQLSNLVHLCLDRNRLTGGIPPELGQLANLLWLHLHNNFDLAGSLPATLTNLRLDALLLQGTQLCVPADPAMQAWLADIQDARVEECGRLDPDRGALVALYNATNGADWIDKTNWLNENPLNSWHGVSTDANGRVTHLKLDNNNLNGTLPGELGQLSFLRVVSLGSNGLTGNIPSEIGYLTNLEEVQIEKNSLNGSIPPELGQLDYLTRFNAYDNLLTGVVPPELGQLSNLGYMSLNNNKLTGTIPPELGRITKLEWLRLNRNALTGEIPPELGSLALLRGLFLSSNQLTGEIPPELGNLTGLQYLELGFNGLTGTIPPQLGGLRKLLSLDLTRNHLSGVLPPELGQLTNLDGMSMARNRLTGPIPYTYGQISNLRYLILYDNPGLTGLLPRGFLHLEKLEGIEFSGTQVCAPNDADFSAWLAGLRNRAIARCGTLIVDRGILTVLYHATGGPDWEVDTNWQSNLPLDQWYGVTTDEQGRVTALDLSDNDLVGAVPSELARLPSLRSLRLENNMGLTGPLPVEIIGLRLESLQLAGTGLCAFTDDVFQQWLLSVPDRQVSSCAAPEERDALVALYKSLGGSRWRNNNLWLSDRPLSQWYGITTNEAGRIVGLDLDGNNLVGTVHSFAGSFAHIEVLSLAGNSITGAIPSSLGDLSNLKTLVLSSNRFEGGIPPELGGLSSLESLDLSANRLGGGIPSELGGLASLKQLNLHGNGLSGSMPSSLGGLSDLRQMLLSENALSGEIPTSLGDLSTLERLNLAGNMLTGGIPRTFGNLAALKELDLSANSDMAGALPSAVIRLDLNQFHLQETNLCVPLDDKFQSWFKGIPDRNGVDCPSEFRALASLVQTTQTLRDPVPLVAGRPALLRVFLTTDGVANMPPIRVTFYGEGAEIHKVEIPARGDNVPQRIDESSLGNSANALIPGEVIVPGLELVVEVDPEDTLGPGIDVGGRFPETGRTSVEVQEIPALDLTLVPLLWSADPDYAVVLETTGLTRDDELFRMTRDLLPMGNLDLTVREPLWTSVDPVARMEAANVLFRELGAARAMDGSGRHYMGVLHRGTGYINFSGIAEQPGYLSLIRTHDRIIAHALGHNMNLGHADCGYGYPVRNDYPHEDGVIGSWGYDLRSNRLIPPDSPDLMTNCWPSWIGDYNFRKAMRYRLRDVDLPAVITPNTADSGRSLLIWGGLDGAGELVLEPAFAVAALSTILGSTSGPSGPYRISGEDAHGNVLFDFRFAMAETNDADGGAFAFTVPVSSDWTGKIASITLSGPAGVVEIDGEGNKAVALLLDSATGMVRGFMRNLPASGMLRPDTHTMLSQPGMDAVISRGVPDAASWKR